MAFVDFYQRLTSRLRLFCLYKYFCQTETESQPSRFEKGTGKYEWRTLKAAYSVTMDIFRKKLFSF